MVALLIFAMTMILSLRAMEQARRSADIALEVRTADGLLKDLMQESPDDLAPSQGSADGFDWTLVTEITGAERPIAVCRRAARLINQASGRKYQASSFITCPPEVTG